MEITTDLLEQELVALESVVSSARLRQVVLIREADRRQLPTADGCRSLSEWVASRLDVAPETASALTRVAVAEFSETEDASFDRIVELSRLSCLPPRAERVWSEYGEAGRGAHTLTVHDSLAFDISGLRRHIASCRRMTRMCEREAFAGRFLAMQPNLDETFYRLWGQLTGVDGKIVEAALDRKADGFPKTGASLGQRRADALVSLSQGETSNNASVPLVSVFIDADRFTRHGETGVSMETGPRIGADTLEELVCTGNVELNTTVNGTPMAVGRKTPIIASRLHRYVLHRDRGCVIDACTSRYRLQTHHVVAWSEGGETEAENLATLCWYHHHIAIHGMGLQLDPNTPPQRKRFLPP